MSIIPTLVCKYLSLESNEILLSDCSTSKTERYLLLPVSQSLTVLFIEADARVLPSGVNAIALDALKKIYTAFKCSLHYA